MNFTMPFTRATRMRALTIGVIALGVLSLQVGRGTMAYFTTQVKSDTLNTFTAGNLHFNIGDNNQALGAGPVNASIKLTNMKPGDSVFAPILLSNIGSLDAQYGIMYSTTATSAPTDLTTALKIGVVGAGSGVTALSTPTVMADCIGTKFATNTIWAEQILQVPESMTSAGRKIIDSTLNLHPVTDGAYVPGDKVGGSATGHGLASLPMLHAGAAAYPSTASTTSDILCFEVTFPDNGAPLGLITEDNQWNAATAQSFNATIIFTFDGQQRNILNEYDQISPGTAVTTGNF
jgi:predicted ribosomally synthesized peptide with SipW-like signal peptide